MYCNNCGEKGHVFKGCKEPIISCGLILLRGIYEPLVFPENPKNVSALMVRRKDSMCYTEFLRGKYNLADISYVKKLLSNMTIAEQKRIKEDEFDTLWTSLWGPGKDIHSMEYELSKEKFNNLNRVELITSSPSVYTEPEWGFPKGRRARGEADLDCAIREFSEETNIPSNSYSLSPTLQFTETFSGTNNVKYKHIYFVAKLVKSEDINLKQGFTSMQEKEISAIAWKTLAESRAITRPHYIERKNLINTIEKTIQTLVEK
jgi:8-oxo-dGTP pyrophosphatase MutT (NUDIX family)